MKKNGIVSLWKFIFAIVIALFHTNILYPNYENPLFRWGYIAVEFYFIICGYYFAKKLIKEKYNKDSIGQDTVKYITNKIKNFALFLLIAFILCLIIKKLYSPLKTEQCINSIFDLMLLSNVGVGNVRILGQLWYLTVMLIVLFILYPLVKKYKKNFIYIVSPIIIILGLGIIGHYYGNLNISHKYWLYIINPSLIRGLVDINIGMILYLINYNLKSVNYTKLFKFILTVLGEILLIIVLLVTTFVTKAYRYDFVMLLMISVAVLIICSEKTFEYKLLSNKFFFYLDKLSMIIYINHIIFIFIVFYLKVFAKLEILNKALLAIAFTIIFSIIEERVLTFVNKIPKEKLKKLFIKA